MKIHFFLALAAAIATSCGGSQTTDKTTDGKPEKISYNLEFTDVMKFFRGIETSYDVVGQVENDDTTHIEIDGLPSGASFKDGKITWTPSCDLGVADGLFMHGYEVYRLRITLTGETTSTTIQSPAIIILHQFGEESPCI